MLSSAPVGSHTGLPLPLLAAPWPPVLGGRSPPVLGNPGLVRPAARRPGAGPPTSVAGSVAGARDHSRPPGAQCTQQEWLRPARNGPWRRSPRQRREVRCERASPAAATRRLRRAVPPTAGSRQVVPPMAATRQAATRQAV